MASTSGAWGSEIAVEEIGGGPFRLYSERPRRVESLLALADRRRGDRIFILGWNGPEWIVNFWACLEAGAIPVLANTWWSGPELTDGLALLEPALTLADTHAATRMPPGRRCGPWAIDTATGQGTGPSGGSEDEEETALIIFTSGTSGRPKAVVLSHRAVLARLHMTLQVTRKLPHQVEESAGDVALITGPLFHVGQMQTLLRSVVVGDTLVVTQGRYDPAEVLETIERHKISRWTAVPTMVSRLLDHPDVSRRDLSSLKSISIGGAPVHAELMQRMRSSLPSVSPRIPTGYGLTENGGQATGSAGSDKVELLGSTGKPMPLVEISFHSHPGMPDGEILLRSPTQMSGYYGLDESPIDSQGWLHTGDLGRLDERGNLWITGRSKDMIIRGGENIAPAAVERALMAIPGVAEAAVIGVPHPDLGEEVMAIVVVPGDLSAEQIRERLRGNVASFAVPSRWRIQKEPLPTNQAGKVDKPALVALVRSGLEVDPAGASATVMPVKGGKS